MIRFISLTSPRVLSLFAFPFFILLGCQKDNTKVEQNRNCKKEFQNLPALTYYVNDRYDYRYPCTNPNNSNEFVYNYIDRENDIAQLIKYNIQSGIKTVLVNNAYLATKPDWSKKGWIAFDKRSNKQMYLVKDNGDSLKQITNQGCNQFPVWNTNAEKLYWRNTEISCGTDCNFVSKALYGSIIDTLIHHQGLNKGLVTQSTVSKQNEIFSFTLIDNSPVYAVSSLDNLNFRELVGQSDLEHFTHPYGTPTWGVEGNYIYCNFNQGVYSINANNGNFKKLINTDGCAGYFYTNISATSDGNSIIGERVEREHILDENANPTSKIARDRFIYKINLQTLEQTKIDLK